MIKYDLTKPGDWAAMVIYFLVGAVPGLLLGVFMAWREPGRLWTSDEPSALLLTVVIAAACGVGVAFLRPDPLKPGRVTR